MVALGLAKKKKKSKKKSKKSSSSKTRDRIQVVCRFRPQNSREKRKKGKPCIEIAENSKSVKLEAKGVGSYQYSFDHIFGMDSQQQDVFKVIGLPVVQAIFDGYNGTAFVYGQTGAGKSYSMMGPNDTGSGYCDDNKAKGLIPRIVEHIFDRVLEADESMEFAISVSYIEIYLEKLRDLFNPLAENLSIKEDRDSGRGIYVDGASSEYVGSVEHVLKLMKKGGSNRVVSGHLQNAESSRSHSIFILTLTQKNTETSEQKSGTLFLVDLAGSERLKKTGAEGQLLEEAKKINQSLSALGNVINALTDGKGSHVPYRDSKLTRLLQDSLGGNCRTTLMICCSPSTWNSEETLSTLRFGMRAKSIKNKAKINRQYTVKELKKLWDKSKKEIKHLKAYNAGLEDELKLLKKMSGVGTPMPPEEVIEEPKEGNEVDGAEVDGAEKLGKVDGTEESKPTTEEPQEGTDGEIVPGEDGGEDGEDAGEDAEDAGEDGEEPAKPSLDHLAPISPKTRARMGSISLKDLPHVKELNDRIEELEDQLDEMKEENNKLQDENDKLGDESSDLKVVLERAQAELTQVQTELEEKKEIGEKFDLVQNQFEMLQIEMEKHKHQQAEKQLEIDSLLSHQQVLESEIEMLKDPDSGPKKRKKKEGQEEGTNPYELESGELPQDSEQLPHVESTDSIPSTPVDPVKQQLSESMVASDSPIQLISPIKKEEMEKVQDKLTQELGSDEEIVKELTEQNRYLYEKIEQLTHQVEKLKKQNEKNKKMRSSLEAQKMSMMRDLRNRCDKVIDLEMNLDEARDRYEHLAQICHTKEPQRKMMQMDTRLHKLSISHQKLNNMVSDLKLQLKITENKLAIRNDRISNLEQALEGVIAKSNKQTDKHIQYRAKIMKRETQMQREIKQLKQRIEQLGKIRQATNKTLKGGIQTIRGGGRKRHSLSDSSGNPVPIIIGGGRKKQHRSPSGGNSGSPGNTRSPRRRTGSTFSLTNLFFGEGDQQGQPGAQGQQKKQQGRPQGSRLAQVQGNSRQQQRKSPSSTNSPRSHTQVDLPPQ